MATQLAPTRERRSIAWSKVVVHLILTTIGLACLIPMILVISVSLSDEKIVNVKATPFASRLTTFAYDYILRNPRRSSVPMA